MKRTLSIMIALAVVGLAVPSFADTATQFKGGLRDVMTSPLQVSDNVKMETAGTGFLPFAVVGGVLKGSFYMVKQVVTGTYDMVTSPIDMVHK